MLKKAAVLMCALLIAGCGYRMVLSDKDSAFTLYPSKIQNLSTDIKADTQFKDAVNYYLASAGILKNRTDAAYNGEFTLNSVKSTGTSSNSVTSTANLIITMHVDIYSKDGTRVFSDTFTASENYDNTNSQAMTTSNRQNAVKKASEKAMADFRNAFQRNE